MKNHTIILLAIGLSVLYTAIYFWVEGFHLWPDPRHWWWHASATAMWGFSLGSQYQRWSSRRALERLMNETAHLTQHLTKNIQRGPLS